MKTKNHGNERKEKNAANLKRYREQHSIFLYFLASGGSLSFTAVLDSRTFPVWSFCP